MTIHERHDCRACHAEGLVEILDLDQQPLANSYIADIDMVEQRYPLSLQLCEACGMVQLGHVVDPAVLFGSYSFRTGSSQRMVDHFSKLFEEVSQALTPDSLVVEIGANDGIALASIAGRVRVLGVDPAGIASSVPILAKPFTEQLASEIAETYGQANVIVACNVLGHVDNLDDFLKGVVTLLRDDGSFVFEVPYLGELLDGNEWDTIYHEHLSYFSITPLLILLARHNLRTERVSRQDVHGGSIRCQVVKGSGQSKSVQRWRETCECWRDLTDPVTYNKLEDSVITDRESLRLILSDFHKRGQRVIGYGAPAKATVRLNVCGIGTDLLATIVDCTLEKQNRFVPGTHQRIVSPKDTVMNDFDVALILPMNHEQEIREKLTREGYRGKIMTPNEGVVV